MNGGQQLGRVKCERSGVGWPGRALVGGVPEAEVGSGEESRCEPAASHWPSALDFFGAVFISGEDMGRLLAGLVPGLSLLVSCNHLTWVAGP